MIQARVPESTSERPKAKCEPKALVKKNLLGQRAELDNLTGLERFDNYCQQNHSQENSAFCDRDLLAMSSQTTEEGSEYLGFVGLVNQGATCYMNSLLQVLFCTPAFRRLVYEIPRNEEETVRESDIGLALQRLFCHMQLEKKACETIGLTKSFGWERSDLLKQQDIQEFSRWFFDRLLTGKQKSILDGFYRLFEGFLKSYIHEKSPPDAYRKKTDKFCDLSMDVRGLTNLMESFRSFVHTEVLESGETKDIKFVDFPRILYLHLKRFEYVSGGGAFKVNDRFEFPVTIDVKEFLEVVETNDDSSVFDLYGVIVHSGEAEGGHYCAFVRTSAENPDSWIQFNDVQVTRATVHNAVEDNFGGSSSGGSAYMLIYVRRNDASEIYNPVRREEIPRHLS
jgi:ubiquitin carboxyl-terminal hydrolase 7